ncbi:hypothetical protein KR054_008147 [Drosophila jambulina]|nr:hypothetical protein KR054_008147 [Drosophila jambulina]
MSSNGIKNFPPHIASLIYPKPLPEIRLGPVMDDMGFTLSERLALRRAWNIIRPFSRRFGQDVFYTFLNKEYWGLRKFGTATELDLKALHSHALKFVRFMGLLIEEQDPIMFQLMISDNNVTHSRCKVGSIFIGELAKALVDYLLSALQMVSSPTLERGFGKLVEKFQAYQDNHTITSTYARLSKN